MRNNNKNITVKTTSCSDDLIARGAAAQQERVRVLGYIKSLEDFIRNSYYDKSEIQEAEESLARHEARLAELDAIIVKAEHAKQTKLNMLKSELTEIEGRMEFLSKKIDACDINMYDSRFPDVEADYRAYNEDFMHLYNDSRKIAAEIARYQKTK